MSFGMVTPDAMETEPDIETSNPVEAVDSGVIVCVSAPAGGVFSFAVTEVDFVDVEDCDKFKYALSLNETIYEERLLGILPNSNMLEKIRGNNIK